MRKYSAVLFDLDGTILENEDVYGKAFAAVFNKHKIPPLDSEYPHTPGIGMEATILNTNKTPKTRRILFLRSRSLKIKSIFSMRLALF